eukprot:5082458-Amphidinium_carterae.1
MFENFWCAPNGIGMQKFLPCTLRRHLGPSQGTQGELAQRSSKVSVCSGCAGQITSQMFQVGSSA